MRKPLAPASIIFLVFVLIVIGWFGNDRKFGDIAIDSATTPTLSLKEQVEALPDAAARADFKGTAIAGKAISGTFSDPASGITVEVQSVSKIDGGIQVYARAWKKGQQLGFGADGSVDIERFRIFNPPIMVPDGTTHTVTMRGVSHEESNFKEDPVQAVVQTLMHTISVAGKTGTAIVPLKIGNTTDTYFPDANVETTSFDGSANRDIGNPSAQTWATFRAATASVLTQDSSASASIVGLQANDVGGAKFIYEERGWLLFDSSALPDTDTISSATLSLWATAKRDDNSAQWGASAKDLEVVSATVTSNTGATAADYNITQFGSTEFGVIAYASVTTGAYNDITLNASGIAAVSKTSITKFGTLTGATFDNVDPGTGAVNGFTGNTYAMADTAGTTNDPKLVVVHAAAAGAPYMPEIISSQ